VFVKEWPLFSISEIQKKYGVITCQILSGTMRDETARSSNQQAVGHGHSAVITAV